MGRAAGPWGHKAMDLIWLGFLCCACHMLPGVVAFAGAWALGCFSHHLASSFPRSETACRTCVGIFIYQGSFIKVQCEVISPKMDFEPTFKCAFRADLFNLPLLFRFLKPAVEVLLKSGL